MSNKNEEKWVEYAALLSAKVAELFDEDSDSTMHLNAKQMSDDETLTDFIHALANVMPNHLYGKITGDERTSLEFNHIANHLCFQYSKKID